MSLAHLAPPALLAAVRDGRAAVSAAGSMGVASVSNVGLGEAIAELSELESQVVALRLSFSAEADQRGAAADTADTGTYAWLARLTGEPREIAAGGLWSPGCCRTAVTTPARRWRRDGCDSRRPR